MVTWEYFDILTELTDTPLFGFLYTPIFVFFLKST